MNLSIISPVIAQAEAAALGGVFIVIAFIVGILLLIAPLGIWNRLIKIHRAQIAAEKARAASALALAAKVENLSKLAIQIASIRRVP